MMKRRQVQMNLGPGFDRPASQNPMQVVLEEGSHETNGFTGFIREFDSVPLGSFWGQARSYC